MNLPGGNDGNPPGRTELTSIRLRALAATHMPFIAPHLVAWPRPHGTVVCHTPCYVRRIRTSSALRTAILCGSHVNRLPSPPGHRLRIDKMLQCLTGMRPYRDSNVSLEVEESSSTPQTGSMEGILQCSESPRPVLGVADHGFERRGCSWTAA